MPRKENRAPAQQPAAAATVPASRDYPAERKALVAELKVQMKQEDSQLAQAKIWMELVLLAEAEKSAQDAMPEIKGYLSSAQALLSTPELSQDAAFADACRTYAPVFARFGREAYAKELLFRASML